MPRELGNGANVKGPLQVGGSAGTSGQVLVSKGAGSTPTWQNFFTSQTPYISGRYYYPLGCTGTSGTGALRTVGRVEYLPFYCAATATFTRIGTEVTTGSAGKLIRLGIYDADSANGQPKNLLLDAGTVSAGAAAVVEATISYTMVPGLYWLGFVTDAAITLRSVSSNGQIQAAWFGLTSSTATAVNAAYFESGSGTTLPSTAAGSLSSQSIGFPVWLRVV